MHRASILSRIRPHTLGALIPLLLAAGAIAGSGAGEGPRSSTAFVCPDGDRFTVDFHPGHVRLRHGSGVFALSRETADKTERYSDGRHTLWLDKDGARIEGAAGSNGHHRCRPVGSSA